MTSQDLGPFRNLVNNPVLMSYNVDLELRTCSCHSWQGTRIPCAHALTALREKKLLREEVCKEYFLTENFMSMYENCFIR